ncbi:MAG TPA: HD-GYP domain-containing protein [Lachnospiraceae bacterium]|nr:HD-GYP domain-containing protein [Lachnospiraceae bacterium]HBR02577.1 HD-GYP domain-containing protein [Ruminiclostridium sp.]
MRRVRLNRALVGVPVARTIISLDGIVLLSAGSTLTEEIITNLGNYKITEIYIDDDYSKGISVPETVKEEIITDVKAQIKRIMSMPSIKISVDSEKIIGIVNRLVASILENDFIIVSLSDIRSIDDYTYSHSVNVCIFSLIISLSLGIKGKKLRDIGVGALLHDIGKVMVSEDILKKPSALTMEEYAEVQKHTVYGYDILKNSPGFHPTVRMIALTHHERIDGSGYPYNLKNNDLSMPSRIVAAADVFDALTTDRVYRKKMLPNEVMEYMASLAGKYFDKAVINALISHIANFPVGTAVILNSGEKGLVIKNNPRMPNRPVIRVVLDEQGQAVKKSKEVDLSKRLEYRVIDMWDI